MSDVFLLAGLRTPFVKVRGVYARHSALEMSIPIVQRMRAQALPDLLVWVRVVYHRVRPAGLTRPHSRLGCDKRFLSDIRPA
jgi:hypothetical protein